MLYCYKLRVDLDTVGIDDIKEVLCRYFTDPPVYAYCIEGTGTDNPHCHWYFESKIVNTTIRASLRKLLKNKGNRAYSLVQIEEKPVEYFAYIIKDKKHQFLGIPQTLIEQAIEYDNKVKNDLKKKKEKKEPLLDYVYTHFKGGEWDLHEVATFVIDTLLERGQLIRRFHVQSIVDTVMCKLSKKNYSNILQKII